MSWTFFKRTQKNERRPLKARARFRPVVELMEDRVVPAVVDAVNYTEATYVNGGSNLNFATAMAWAPDGSNRLFVARKFGQVRIVENGALVATPFATVSPVFTNSECGVIGITFDRDYVNNRYVYLFVTVSSSEQQIIRYTDSSNIGTSKTTLVAGLPTAGANHDGGSIVIGTDNKLYWAIGDLGNGTGVNNNLTTLAAKVGRANLDGSPVSDNPFNDNDGIVEPADYIWARGFRNPFTSTIQESTGQLWVNVVGTSYEQVFKVNAGSHAGYNNLEANQTGSFMQPEIVYRTNGSDTRNFSSATRVGNVATYNVTGTLPQGFLQPGGRIIINGAADSTFNGTFDILAVPSTTSFTVAQVAPNASTTGGVAATENFGGCITGGAFYTSTAFPLSDRNAFFFGDYNSGNVMRATIDATNNVTSVRVFATGITNVVDVTVGPDGALYYIGAGSDGIIRRTTFNAGTTQNLIVTNTSMNLVEGGQQGFSVRLATAPAGNVTVNVGRTAGDSDLSVVSGSTLTFTPANFATPQAVILAAAHDADTTNDNATFSISSTGLTTQTVNANAIDNDTRVIVLSTTDLSVNEGGTATFTVALQNAPTGNVTVNVARTAGDPDITVSGGATLTFTPANFSTTQTVTIAAAEDADLVNDIATLTISASGAESRTVAVTGIDNDAVAPAFTSSPVLTSVVNVPYTYDANASGLPVPTYSLDVFPTGMIIDPVTGVISWTPTSTGPANVTVRAANGIAPDATQSFTIAVNSDAPPTATLTQPTNGATVSGASAEFFGDGHDDVGTVRAEFYVDGVLGYTDTTPGGHYHFGGEHLMWNTTLLSNGPHTLRMVVVDTIGQTGFAEVSVIVDNRVATSTVLTATPNATTGGELVTFTATVGPSPGNLGTVTFRDNGTAIPAGTDVPVIGGVATFTTSTLSVGSHPISAIYSGALGFETSTSNALDFVVSPAATSPQVVGVVVNGNIAALAGPQRSRVAGLQVTFDQPVQLDANAFTLALHNNNVSYGGVAGPFGSLPTNLVLASTDNITWSVTFDGNTDPGSPPDGLNSLKDGVYAFAVDAAKVHPLGVPTTNGIASAPTVFHRLFGDANAPLVSGADFTAVTTTDDNLGFRTAFNTPANYQAAYDFDGDGFIVTSDNLQFRNRFNRPLTWSV